MALLDIMRLLMVVAVPVLFSSLWLVGSYVLFRVHWPVRMRRSLGDLPPVRVPEVYRLRLYQPSDWEGWVQLINAAFATEWCVSTQVSQSARRRVLDGVGGTERRRILLAEQEASREVVGTAEAAKYKFMNRRLAVIQWVAVHPAHRGHRLGEALVLAALHDLRERGHTEALLYTNLALTSAMRLYERLGFESGKVQRQ